MVDLNKHGIEETSRGIVTNDLILLANITEGAIDTKVLRDNSDTLLIKGKYDIQQNTLAVVGGEIVEVISSAKEGDDTLLKVIRSQEGTTEESQIGFRFRTVIPIEHPHMTPLDWSFEDTTGSIGSNLFPAELGSGSISFKSDLSLWSPHEVSRKYRVAPNKSIAYIFKGVGSKRILKFTTIISKIGFNTRGLKDPNKIKLDIKTKLAQWYDKDLAVNQQLKSTTPKELFQTLFGMEDNEVYYADGVDSTSFVKIANLHTKEYKKYSELLKAYCSNGIRFTFDAKERVKIFSDFKVGGIKSTKTFEYNITNSMLTEDERMIYNTIDTSATQRLPMFNFEDLNNKYVEFYKVERGIINSKDMMKRDEKGEVFVNGLDIINESIHESVQLEDYVLFKMTVSPFLEFYASVRAIERGDKINVMPMLYDKDYILLQQGKAEYLYGILTNASCPMDLYYVREELPMVFKYTRAVGGEEKDSSLMYPILPMVDGEAKYEVENLITFGSASNLKVGEYTGIVEEIDGIYGMWESDKLLYNKELTQFANESYPPIFALSNKVEEKLVQNEVGKTAFLLNYTHFDNSDLRLTIEKPKKAEGDAVLKLANTTNVNSNIDTIVGEEIGRVSHSILQVENILGYEVGDVLILNRPEDLSSMEEAEFDEILSTLKWRIIAKESQLVDESTWKHYIFLDNNYPKRDISSKKYAFTKFPNWSIVYLQELYFRGNPIIQHTQEVVGLARGVNVQGDGSNDLYGEKKYEFDSKQLDKEGLKMLMGYILDNFQATTTKNTKFNLPISLFNGIGVEVLDVISIIDPVFTKVTEDIKWLVVSVSSKAKTNEVQLKLININEEDTKPWKIDIKDVIEYTPVEIPKYDHVGGEGNTEDNNDGTGGSGEDKTLGQFWLAEIDSSKFKAKIDKVVGNYIYFKDFGGEEWELYASKLFPQGEFGVNINGEVIFVESDMNYRAFMKKRSVYNTDKVDILPEMNVTFYVVTTNVDIDGTFYSRKVHIGDGDTYFDFHPIKGAKFVGDFVIGENNKTPENDLWQSLQNNRTFYEDKMPISTGEYGLKEGDLWYDMNDENHTYRHNGDVWVSCRDGSIVSSKTSAFIQDTAPVSTEGRPLREGDTWYDTSANNRPHVYMNGSWVNVSDMSLEEAINQAKEQAEKSLALLSDIANDSKLTPDEKHSTKKEWDIISSEHPPIVEEALKFSVSTTEYKASYKKLESYLAILLDNKEITTDIDGDEFRGNFTSYYTEKQYVLNGITSAIKVTSDGIQETILEVDKKADDAYKHADGANNLLKDIADDNKLTPSEKHQVKLEIDVINGEYQSNVDKAVAFEVSTTQYKANYTALISYITPLITDMTTTSNINGNTFRVNFSNYYTERQKMLNSVYDGVKDASVEEAVVQANTNAQKVIDALKDSLESQIDGKIDSFYQEADPSISWTATEKENAKGDLWYKPSSEQTFRWNGKAWDNITDKAEDQVARDLAQSKRAVYTAQPTTPYTKGDLWVTNLTSSGDLYVCIEDRDTGSYVSADWSKATKYTDDTKATEALTNASNAQTSANTANNLLSDIASDNKLTPSEKQIATLEWDVIKAEYTINLDKASMYGVAVASRNAYTSAYNTLNTYLTPLLGTNLVFTSNIVGSDFRSKFSTYYNSRQVLLNAIYDGVKDSAVTDAVKESTTNAQKVVDALGDTLQTQIDGKIDTWNQESDPASAWTTSDLKLKHTGDLWYKPSEKATRRYSGSAWSLLEVEDKLAQELAQAKKRVFVDSQPSPPYDIGDFWLGGGTPSLSVSFNESSSTTMEVQDSDTSGTTELYVCRVARATGSSFSKGDWGKATKYTDDTLANISKQEAEKALGSANASKELLEDIADDNKLTSSEKNSIKLEWDIISDELYKNMEKATLYGVDLTLRNTYNKTYEELDKYLHATILVGNRYPLMYDRTQTSSILGSEFRLKFSGYYDARQVLLNAIYDKVKDVAVEESVSTSKKHADLIDKKVDDYSSDGVLTVGEKADLRVEIETLEARYTTLSGRAGVFSVSVATLNTYKTTLTTWRTGILSQTGIYNNPTQIAKLRNDFKAYYVEEEKVYDLIERKAKELADKAQSDANGANGLLADISNDDKLTPSEKQSTKKEWDIIVGEKTRIDSEADKFSVSKVAYGNTYNTLNTYVSPLLSSLTTTTTIVGTTFRANFTNYYNARQDLLNAISTKAKELADKAQNDATTALGNAKVFHQTTAPTTGMKKNDLWYDTDDQNHPHVYNGSAWISARDKIFETEGGNKVYFQDAEPPTSGTGIKDGDTWFKTNENNKMFILKSSKWVLATSADDSIANGRIVLNGNTTIEGNFTVRGKNIDLTGDTKITGELKVFGGDRGIISYDGVDEASSTKMVVIKGGVIEFWERV